MPCLEEACFLLCFQGLKFGEGAGLDVCNDEPVIGFSGRGKVGVLNLRPHRDVPMCEYITQEPYLPTWFTAAWCGNAG